MTAERNMNITDRERSNVAGYFSDCSKAEQAISNLRAVGFSDNQIGIAVSDGDVSGKESSSGTGGQHHERGVWDRVKSAFTGESEKTEATRAGFGPDYAYADDFPRYLVGTGATENEARYFNSRLHQGGGCLLTVNTSGGRTADAIAIMERNGADIGAAAVNFDNEEDVSSNTGERRIQLLGEMLRVHKELVQKGEVRVRKEVVTENRMMEVPVTREELVIERRDASGGVPVDTNIGEGEEIRVPLTEEQVRVDKQPVVTDEVRIGKKQVTDTRKVSDTVKHEEVKVEKKGDVKVDDKDLGKGGGRKVA
jgi:uncharacterized protein (TIGR02271 family)